MLKAKTPVSGTLSGLPTTSTGAGAGAGAERGTGSEACLDGEALRLLLLAARSLASLPRLMEFSSGFGLDHLDLKPMH